MLELEFLNYNWKWLHFPASSMSQQSRDAMGHYEAVPKFLWWQLLQRSCEIQTTRSIHCDLASTKWVVNCSGELSNHCQIATNNTTNKSVSILLRMIAGLATDCTLLHWQCSSTYFTMCTSLLSLRAGVRVRLVTFWHLLKKKST